MGPIEIILAVLIGAAAVFIAITIALTVTVRRSMFGNRFAYDPLVKTYSPEMFDLGSKPFETDLGGEKLRGALYFKNGSDTDKSTLIIVCHGMWTGHMSYMQDVGYLCGAGFEVLAFDYIGTSLSDGKNLGGFGQSLRSLDAVIRSVKSDAQFSGRKIFVYGHSWGGYAVTNIVKFHPDIEGVVALAPATSFDAVAKKNFPKGIHFLIPVAKLFDRAKTGKFANRNALKSLAGYGGRVLIVHSEDDHMCPYSTTTRLLMKSLKGDNFKYLIMKDRGHNPNYTPRALEIMREYSKTLPTLTSAEEMRKYKENTDFLAMGELDSKVMDEIVAHIKNN